MAKVGLVTYSGLPGMTPDEDLLTKALATRDVGTAYVVWDDPSVAWGEFAACVIRCTWDYHHRRAEFTRWAEEVNKQTGLWNPAPVLVWNTHKGYLADLERAGVAVIPTVWVEPASPTDIRKVVEERGWEEIVVKPAVSASAYLTARFRRDQIREAEAHLERGLARGSMMVQPYLASVETEGERSLIYFNSEFSHAVRRTPALVQDPSNPDKARTVTPEPDELALAEKALRAGGFDILYARVDMARDDRGQIRLMELELVEPFLFLEYGPQAAQVFAKAIANRL